MKPKRILNHHQKQTLRELGKHVGVKIVFSTHICSPEPTYSKGEIRLPKKAGILDVAHEVAHWIVATSEERNLPNFGLGSDPLQAPNPNTLTARLGWKETEHREGLASMLGILIERQIGHTKWNHGFRSMGWEGQNTLLELEKLEREGLIRLGVVLALKGFQGRLR